MTECAQANWLINLSQGWAPVGSLGVGESWIADKILPKGENHADVTFNPANVAVFLLNQNFWSLITIPFDVHR